MILIKSLKQNIVSSDKSH